MASKELKPGDRAPDFDLPADGGRRIALARLKGKPVVLYFYPKDNTSGCTAEALAFSKDARGFAQAGAVVVGVSKDSVASHDRFKGMGRKEHVWAPLHGNGARHFSHRWER